MDYQAAIIDKIKRNRISTTEVADCLDKTGAIPNVTPLNRGHFRVGEVFWAYAYNESNWECHEQLRRVKDGQIVLVEAFDCNGRAIFGSLVTKFVFLYRQVAAVVVQGALRDVPHLIKENWPIWLEGVSPIGCFNVENNPSLDPEVVRQRQAYYEGAIGVCDDSGVVIVTREHQNAEFLERLDFIENQEDTWFDCVDRLKWDTYDTVCLKKYKDAK